MYLLMGLFFSPCGLARKPVLEAEWPSTRLLVLDGLLVDPWVNSLGALGPDELDDPVLVVNELPVVLLDVLWGQALQEFVEVVLDALLGLHAAIGLCETYLLPHVGYEAAGVARHWGGLVYL